MVEKLKTVDVLSSLKHRTPFASADPKETGPEFCSKVDEIAVGIHQRVLLLA